MRDEPTPVNKPSEPVDKPRYRVHFETSADSPEELHRKIQRGMGRVLKSRVKRVATRRMARK